MANFLRLIFKKPNWKNENCRPSRHHPIASHLTPYPLKGKSTLFDAIWFLQGAYISHTLYARPNFDHWLHGFMFTFCGQRFPPFSSSFHLWSFCKPFFPSWLSSFAGGIFEICRGSGSCTISVLRGHAGSQQICIFWRCEAPSSICKSMFLPSLGLAECHQHCELFRSSHIIDFLAVSRDWALWSTHTWASVPFLLQRDLEKSTALERGIGHC